MECAEREVFGVKYCTFYVTFLIRELMKECLLNTSYIFKPT